MASNDTPLDLSTSTSVDKNADISPLTASASSSTTCRDATNDDSDETYEDALSSVSPGNDSGVSSDVSSDVVKKDPGSSSFDMRHYAVIDFNTYRGLNGERVVKELSLVGMPDRSCQHWVFAPPYSFATLPLTTQKQNRDMQSKIQYSWDEGEVAYDHLKSVLKGSLISYDTIYIQGQCRSNLIANMIGRSVTNIRPLYDWYKYGCKISENGNFHPYINYWDPTCMRHTKQTRFYCPKARCMNITSVVSEYLKAICRGIAGVEIIHPIFTLDE